jgi:Na+/proline symporter
MVPASVNLRRTPGLAAHPATAVLVAFGSLDGLAYATGIPSWGAGLAHVGMMLLGGVLYGGLFQRAANDWRGGWLFGLAFGFVLWMLGPIPLLQWVPDRPTLTGDPAIGLLLAQLLWGLVLGVLFPFVHRQLHAGLEGRNGLGAGSTGPESAARRLLSRP